MIFGLLDIANIAQPAFVILGSYTAYVLNNAYNWDPILVGLLFTPVFYVSIAWVVERISRRRQVFSGPHRAALEEQ